MKRVFSTVLFLCYKCGLYPGLEHVRGPGPHRPGEGLQVEVAVEDGDWCGQGVAAAQQPRLVLVVDPLQILQGEALLLLPQILVTIPTPSHPILEFLYPTLHCYVYMQNLFYMLLFVESIHTLGSFVL